MEEEIHMRWWAHSMRNRKFDILGYSTKNGDHRDDALVAMEVLSKHLKEPIPSDVELTILGSRQ